jgi:uncharacterized membrane-anchored protein
MKRLISEWPALLGLVLVLGAVNLSIAGKERLVAHGTTVLLELAPVDPRSLMQGDYMRVDTALARQLGEARDDVPAMRPVRLMLDSLGVAREIAFDQGQPLAANEARMQARRRDRFGWRLGSDAYFFQEGTAAVYDAARFGEYRVAADGESVLVGLRDARLKRLGPERWAHPWEMPAAR